MDCDPRGLGMLEFGTEVVGELYGGYRRFRVQWFRHVWDLVISSRASQLPVASTSQTNLIEAPRSVPLFPSEAP